MTHREKWYAGMRKKLGVETDAEVSAFMRENGAKATRSKTGGFKFLQLNDPEKLKSISSLGGIARHRDENSH